MQTIKLNPDVYELLISNKKRSTLRYGVKSKFYLGETNFIKVTKDPIDGEISPHWFVYSIKLIRAKDIDVKIANMEGYDTAEELIQKIKEIYADRKIHEEDFFTQIEFCRISDLHEKGTIQ